MPGYGNIKDLSRVAGIPQSTSRVLFRVCDVKDSPYSRACVIKRDSRPDDLM